MDAQIANTSGHHYDEDLYKDDVLNKGSGYLRGPLSDLESVGVATFWLLVPVPAFRAPGVRGHPLFVLYVLHELLLQVQKVILAIFDCLLRAHDLQRKQ